MQRGSGLCATRRQNWA